MSNCKPSGLAHTLSDYRGEARGTYDVLILLGIVCHLGYRNCSADIFIVLCLAWIQGLENAVFRSEMTHALLTTVLEL